MKYPVKFKDAYNNEYPTVWGKDIKVCQKCRAHRNNPSFCVNNNEHVGRKQEACDEFRSKQ